MEMGDLGFVSCVRKADLHLLVPEETCVVTMCKMYKYTEVEARAQALSSAGNYFSCWAKEYWSV